MSKALSTELKNLQKRYARISKEIQKVDEKYDSLNESGYRLLCLIYEQYLRYYFSERDTEDTTFRINQLASGKFNKLVVIGNLNLLSRRARKLNKIWFDMTKLQQLGHDFTIAKAKIDLEINQMICFQNSVIAEQVFAVAFQTAKTF